MANTMDESNKIPVFLLSDYTNDVITKTYSIITDIIVSLTLLLKPFYFFLIIKKSPEKMKNYKHFLLIYATFTSLITISIAVGRAGLIIPLATSYPIGWIPNLPKIPTLICFIMTYVAGSITTDLLIIAMIQRYFNISKLFLNQTSFTKNFCYYFIVITNIANNAFGQYDQLQGLLPQENLKEYFMLRLDRPNEFLEKYPYVSVSYSSTSFNSPIQILNITIWITRFIVFGIILYKNITFAKKFSLQLGSSTAKNHKMLVKAVITQIISCLICTRLPFVVTYIILQTNNLFYITLACYFYLAALCALPLIDMIITIYFVTPYRKYVLKLFFCKKKFENDVIFLTNTSTV